MKITHQDIGKWYLVEYGHLLTKAKLVRLCQSSDLLVMKSKDMFPFSMTGLVSSDCVLQEVEDPRWIAKIKRLLQKI